jgi:5-methyltetrahydropteroyltriglutamate--homocysteine methyltransferase
MKTQPDGQPPFRAEHVGSLLRPAALRQAFKRHAAGEIDDHAFALVQDQCIDDAIRLQEDIGLKVVTDGEFRRGSYWARFVERTAGLEIRPASFTFHDDHGHEMAFTAPYAVAQLRRVQPLALDEFEFLHKAAQGTPKITLPSPSTMHFFRCADFADRKVYADDDEYFDDLAAVFQQEIADLIAAGCRYVQIDEVAIALLCDPTIRDKVAGVGGDPDVLVDRYIEAINRAVSACPSNVYVGVHMCRGNLKGHYLGEGSYESVAERFFAGVQANHFLLEYDTPRAGDFHPLRHVPRGKGVVLGLVSSKIAELETRDGLRRRLDDAARHIELGRLAISPQCGFASTVAGNPLSEFDQAEKLRLVVDVARSTWR